MTDHTAAPSPETLRAMARHLTEDGDGIDQSVCDEVAAWLRLVAAQPQQPAGWKPIETAPADTDVLLCYFSWQGEWVYEVGMAHCTRGGWWHGRATHWMPLPPTPGAHPSQQEDDLRKAVQLMAGLLKDGEWAEILSSDPDVAALEAEISRLIGAQQEDDARRVTLEDYKTNGAMAVRYAPSSAHWSSELRRLFGKDAREGIERLEERLRAAEQDAVRWRKLMMKVCAYGNALDGYRFDFVNLPKPVSNPMQGSVSQHFEAAIDAMSDSAGEGGNG